MLPFVSLLGLFAILGFCVLMSSDRRAISWRLVGVGMGIQLVLAVLFMVWSGGRDLLFALGDEVKVFLELSLAGSEFVFGKLALEEAVEPLFGERGSGFLFAFQVLPTLIFFAAVMAVLYHIGLMQRIVGALARIMARLLGTSGAESMSACGNIFVGQTEAPLMVRPFLQRMTKSELHAVMTGGYATIAGGVFALYVGAGFNVRPGHLIMASLLAVPAGLVCSKILRPETEQSETLGKVVRVDLEPRANLVDAAASGAGDGLKLALNVAAMLIAFLGLVAVVDWLLAFAAAPTTVPTLTGGTSLPLTLQNLLGLLFYPLAAVMGVQGDEIFDLAQLLGTKIAVTELIAYQQLGGMIDDGTLSPRTIMIASFALCGFANLGSIAIQIGGLSAMAPDRRRDISTLAVRAMMAGALATCLTGCMVGFVVLFASGGGGDG